MRFQATHDLLTSLWNRGVIVELLVREIHRSRREKNCIAIMMCDIDHFKAVNDKFGHSAGDDVLREVSRRLQSSVRSYDMVGRYGGEEFLVVLNKCDPASAVARAENLRQAIFSQPIHLADTQLTLSISVGLALSSEFLTAMLKRFSTRRIWRYTPPKPRDAIAFGLPRRSLPIKGTPDQVSRKESSLLTT